MVLTVGKGEEMRVVVTEGLRRTEVDLTPCGRARVRVGERVSKVELAVETGHVVMAWEPLERVRSGMILTSPVSDLAYHPLPASKVSILGRLES